MKQEGACWTDHILQQILWLGITQSIEQWNFSFRQTISR